VYKRKIENTYLTRSATSAMNADMTDSGTSAWVADSSTISPILPFDGSAFKVVDVVDDEVTILWIVVD